MLIRKLSLENFRCHRKATYEFKEGINLILGKNGAGKSSIVEAIGLALIKGQKTRDGLTEAVTKGEKRYKIELEFEGADGLLYRAVRKSGANPELYLKDESAPLNPDKLPELVGLDIENAEALYTKVVCSHQNQIVSLFDDTSGEIKKHFDKVFNTEIYGKLAGENLKECYDKYKGQAKELEGRLAETRANMLPDRAAVEAEHTLSQARLAQKLVALESVKTELGAKQKRKSELDELGRAILTLEGSVKELEAKLRGKLEMRETARVEFERALEATKIVEARRDEYERNEELAAFLGEINKEIRQLEAEKKKFDQKNDALKKAENEITRAQTNKESSDAQLAEARLALSEETAKLDALRAEHAKMNAERDEVARKFEDFKRKRAQFESIRGELTQAERAREEKDRNAEERTCSLADADELSRLAKENSEAARAVDEAVEELRALESKLDKAKARRDDNANFREALADGYCRILAQRCENVAGGTLSAAERFEALAAKFEAEIASLVERIASLGDPQGEKLRLAARGAELAKALESNRKEKELIAALRSEAVNGELTAARIRADIKAFALESFRELVESDFSIEKFETEIKSHGERISSEVASLAAKSEEKRSQAASQAERSKTAERKAAELNERVAGGATLIETLKREISALRDECERLLISTEPLEDLKVSREELEEEIKELAPAVAEYAQNKKLAARRGEIEQAILGLERDSSALESEIAEEGERLQALRGGRSEDEARLVAEAIVELSALKDARAEEAMNERHVADRLRQELARDAETLEKLSELTQKEKRVSQKRELLEKLRDNIRNLGPGINRRIVASIEAEANNYLSMLSDSGGKISWETEDGSYAVKLAAKGGEKRSFKSLSGGEQVSVALALRAAMANVLTKSDFAIFDEPTNNLDAARREALRESLGNMLSRLKQAVIITHDDTFEGCENHAIRLGESPREV